MLKKLTTEGFICKAKERHGEKYDYSKAIYKGTHTKLIIICKNHGEFVQTPGNHLTGKGCLKCGGRLKLNTVTFIEKANKVHNYKYSYEKVNYINAITKIEILCKVHGLFFQTPNSHLNGNGCPDCGGSKKSSTIAFIKKAEKIHNKKYNYSKVSYKTALQKVKIICHNHGEFLQTPNHHLGGMGCPKCGTEKTAFNQTFNNEIFIKNAIKIHGLKYNYSKVNYINAKTKIIIICNKHGEFLQTPDSHLNNGSGCKKCAWNQLAADRRLTKEEFISRATKIHNNKYNYYLVNYINAHIKVEIICKKHGSFFQTPDGHLQGHGCPGCNMGWTSQMLVNFIKSLSLYLDELSQQELYVLVQQAKILDSNKSKQIMKAIGSKNPRKALTKMVTDFEKDFEKSDELTHTGSEENIPLDKAVIVKEQNNQNNQNDNQINIELPKLEPKSILDTMQFSIDKIKSISSSSDEEAIEFLKASAINKLWLLAFTDPDKLAQELKD